ncbi:hypothetical protein G6514_000373 [Epicoccum nigrum]|nr:hypothetical protein G6514_000373 [Epicoccum nigrum]
MSKTSLPYTVHPLNNKVCIEVGAFFNKDKSKSFDIPSSLLARNSISFKEQFSKGPNTQVHALSFPNYDPDTLDLYLCLVYNNQVPSISGPLPYDILQREQVRFAKLYVLCG